MRRQAARFALVGAAATATHAVVGVGLIRFGLGPLAATALAFAAAFQLSLLGHFFWSFRGAGRAFAAAAPRFGAVAAGGLGLNAALLSLAAPVIGAEAALAAATLGAAGLTFLLSRFWAFKPPREAICSGQTVRDARR